jgi:hypothetical protein
MPRTPQEETVLTRVVDAMREIGTLLLAFAPLDYSLKEGTHPWSLGGFIVAGVLLLSGAVIIEVRRRR